MKIDCPNKCYEYENNWENDYGGFSERKYLSRKELLTEEYDDEFVDIEEERDI